MIDPARIAHRWDGPEDAPVLMLGNSLAASLDMWWPNVAALSQRYRLLRYDMRGHGGSPATAGEYDIERLAGDVVALLDRLGIERVHFTGISLGGMVGQWLGARHGARIKSLTLCDTLSEQPAPPKVWDERIAAVRSRGLAAIVDATLARWFTPDFHARQPRDVARVREMILSTSVDGYAGCAAAVRDLRQNALLASIRAPTLVLTGTVDPVATPAVARDLQSRIESAELTLIENAAHLPNIEQPEMFNAALLRFLDAVERDARA